MEVFRFFPTIKLVFAFQEILEGFLKEIKLFVRIGLMKLVEDIGVATANSMFPTQIIGSLDAKFFISTLLLAARPRGVVSGVRGTVEP